MRAGRLLLIENVDQDAQLVQSVFQDVGAEVIRVTGGSEGLELAASLRPDMVIITDDLPDISGYMICGRLKRSDDLATIPVILTSAKESAAQMFAKHAQKPTRADAYLPKPLQAQQLIDTAVSVGFILAEDGDLTPAPQRLPSGAMLSLEVADDMVAASPDEMVAMDDALLDMDDAVTFDAGEDVVDIEDTDLSVSDEEAEAFIREATSAGRTMAPMNVEIVQDDEEIIDDLDAPVMDNLGSSLGLEGMLEDLEVSSDSSAGDGLEDLLAQHPTADDDTGEVSPSPSPAAETEPPRPTHDVQALKQEVSRLQALLAEQASPKALEAKLREAEQERDALRDVDATQKQTIRRLRDEIERLQETNADIQARYDDVQAQQEQTDHTVESLRAERDDAQRKLTDVVVQNRSLKSQAKELADELEALRAQMTLSNDEMEGMRAELEAAREHASRSQGDASQSLEIVATLRNDLQRHLAALEESLGGDKG